MRRRDRRARHRLLRGDLDNVESVLTGTPGLRLLSRARWATRAQFLSLGFIAGVWGVHVPSIKAIHALDERMLAVLLFALSLGSLLALFIAGRLVARLGARATAVVAGFVVCVALASSPLLPNVAILLFAMVFFGAGESVYDVAINAEGTILETLSGRAVMSGFHGMFSLGGMLGSAASAVLLGLTVPAAQQLVIFAALIATAIAVTSKGMLAEHPGTTSQVHFAWPSGALLVIGTLTCCGMLAEGVMYNWSVLYVQQELHTPQERAALAYVAFAGATAATRFAGDAVRARLSERTMLLAGPTLSATAMAFVLIVARPWAAMVGFALVGVGLATIVPILYNAATRVPGVSRAAAIASVSSIGYLGFMIGPPIVGGIAHATTLTIAMGTLIVIAAILAFGARRVPAPPQPAGVSVAS